MPKIMKGAGRMKLLICEQGPQKIPKGSRKQQKIVKWSKEKRKSSGSNIGKIKREQGAKRSEKERGATIRKEQGAHIVRYMHMSVVRCLFNYQLNFFSRVYCGPRLAALFDPNDQL